jgi:hypothetical protein
MAAVDQRNLNMKASIADIAAKVENNQQEDLQLSKKSGGG